MIKPYVLKSPPVWSTVKSSELFSGDIKIVDLSFISGVVSCAIVLVIGFKVNTKYITFSQNTTKIIVLCFTICFTTTCFGPFL